MAVVNFNAFSLSVYCIFVICQKKLSIHFDLYFQPGVSDFDMAALLMLLKVHQNAFHSWVIS